MFQGLINTVATLYQQVVSMSFDSGDAGGEGIDLLNLSFNQTLFMGSSL